jgi:hypothetical protein
MARKKHGYDVYFSERLFYLVVLVIDGYLATKVPDPDISRFMAIMARLPIELQMHVCHGVYQCPPRFLKESRASRIIQNIFLQFEREKTKSNDDDVVMIVE